MSCLSQWVEQYLTYCKFQKSLSEKTLKAYRIDLTQFTAYICETSSKLNRYSLSSYISYLHQTYKPKSIKRKVASLKALCNYLEYEEIIKTNPFSKIKVKFNEPFLLPKTIPLSAIEAILACAYTFKNKTNISTYQFHASLRDIAVLELLFGTGIRVSELCSLKLENVHFHEREIKILGKGSKERIIQIENQNIYSALQKYYQAFQCQIEINGSFFVNRLHNQLSEQSVRFMITKYAKLADVSMHITPHMFRHPYVKLTTKLN